MIRVAMQSAAYHRRSFLATGIVVVIGTALVAAMAGILATGMATTHGADREFLTEFPLIMGSWILAIVLFAVVSTVAVALDARTTEVTGLRLIGTTPDQVRRMVAVETAAVAIAAAIPGIALSYLFSAIIVAQVRAAGLISSASAYAPGIALPVLAGVLIVIAGIVGGHLGAKTIAGRSPVGAPDLHARAPRGPRIRRIIATVLIALGFISYSTSLAMGPTNVLATAATGPGVVLTAVGLALLAAETLDIGNRILQALPARGPASWHLTRINLRIVPGRIRPVVTFLTLFVGVSAGTLTMQGIENTANADAGGDGMGVVLASINYFVVILIAAFMAIALANNLISAINARHDELATMSLIGATGTQVRSTLTAETLVAVLISAIAATIGAALTVTPFAIAKLGTPLPALSPLPYLLTIIIGAALTIGITTLASRPRHRPRH